MDCPENLMRVMGPLYTHYGHIDVCRTFVGQIVNSPESRNVGEKSHAFSSCHIQLLPHPPSGRPCPSDFVRKSYKMLAAAAW